MVPNSVRDQAGSGPNTPHSTPQRPRRSTSADGRRDHGTPQLPQHGAGGMHRQQSTPTHYNIQRPQSGEYNRHSRPQSGDYGTPPQYMQRSRVTGSPAPQQAPPPQPVYAVPQIEPQTVVHQEQMNQYASLQHHVIQQAAPPQSHYMQLPVANATPSGSSKKETGSMFMIGNPDSDEDDPNWPPPPPPEYMTTVDGVVTGSSSTDRSSSADGDNNERRGSVQESHASIIQSLNQKFAARQHTHNTSLPLEASSGFNNGSSLPRPSSQSSDDITPTAENQSDGSMLNQIQHGVRLRKTASNDRSAPKFT